MSSAFSPAPPLSLSHPQSCKIQYLLIEIFCVLVPACVCVCVPMAVCVSLRPQMFDWIMHNKGLFLTSYTEIGGNHQHAGELQTQHNHFAMNCMVRIHSSTLLIDSVV